MAHEQKEGLTPRLILFIGGGIFVLLFGLCAGESYYVHSPDTAIDLAFGLVLVNIGVAIVTAITAIIVALWRRNRDFVGDGTQLPDASYKSRWTHTKGDEKDKI
jgi:hypothetical protein